MIYKTLNTLFLLIVMFLTGLLGMASADKQTECKDKASFALNTALMKEEGKSDDEVTEWLLAAINLLEKMDTSEEEIERAFKGGILGMGLQGNPQQRANFVYQKCMEE